MAQHHRSQNYQFKPRHPSGLTSLFAVASSTNATIFNILGNGNVGIGTTSPDALLEIHNKVSVYGTDKSLLTLSQSDVPYGVDTFVTDDSLTSGYGRSGYGGLGWSYASASNYKYVMWTKYGDATTDWGKIVHENSSGFVGIGTTTPNAPLDVDYPFLYLVDIQMVSDQRFHRVQSVMRLV